MYAKSSLAAPQLMVVGAGESLAMETQTLTLQQGILTPVGQPAIFNQMVKYSSKTLAKTFALLAEPFRASLPAISRQLRMPEQASLMVQRMLRFPIITKPTGLSYFGYRLPEKPGTNLGD